MFQCPVCHRLNSKDTIKECPYCRTNNEAWKEFKLKEQAKEFPWLVWALVAVVLLLQIALSIRGPLRSWFPEDTSGLPNIGLLLALVSLVIVFAVFFLRNELRYYELIRPYRVRRRPGLIALAATSLAVALVLSVVAMIVLWMLFSAAPRPRWMLMRQDVKSGTDTTLLDNYGRISSPSWSPDGTTLLFASDKDGDWDIYTASKEGMAIRNLTQNTYADYAPSWAKYGTQIVYTSDKSGDPEIFVMDSNGQEVQRLTKTPGKAIVASWSPTEESFVFVTASAGYMPLLGDPIQVGNRLTPLLIVLYGLAFPCLMLAVMLIGERSYITKLGEKFPLPVFTDTNKLADVAAGEAANHVEGFYFDPIIIPDEEQKGSHSQPEPFNSSGRSWTIHHEIPNKDKPIETLSVKRTDNGGIDMIVRFQETTTVEEGGEILKPATERRYAIVADEWGSIRSCQQVNDRNQKSNSR